ncbi:DUF6193 family natural product biosynthesis protein [Streptomyces sp. SBC-4]|nr:DUF6193 family natural product biosynthesis protein [Streptomyces sp. SBC-4]MDV5145801.1 DUF6193 family natural product biosynthesis protein [Streptomyces sp. SBC-4]
MTDETAAQSAEEVVEAQWRTVLSYGPEVIGQEMVRAAYAQPRLRQLFPGVSHGILLLSRCVGYPHTRDVPVVYPLGEGGYEVTNRAGADELYGRCATAEEAFAVVAANLPEGCGPAVMGTADDL